MRGDRQILHDQQLGRQEGEFLSTWIYAFEFRANAATQRVTCGSANGVLVGRRLRRQEMHAIAHAETHVDSTRKHIEKLHEMTHF